MKVIWLISRLHILAASFSTCLKFHGLIPLFGGQMLTITTQGRSNKSSGTEISKCELSQYD